MGNYTKELKRVAIGMLCSWAALPWAAKQLGAALLEVFWSLCAMALALFSPLLLPLAPLLAWAYVAADAHDAAREPATRARLLDHRMRLAKKRIPDEHETHCGCSDCL